MIMIKYHDYNMMLVTIKSVTYDDDGDDKWVGNSFE